MKWFFAIASLILCAGLFFALKYGVAPRAIPLIKATEVENLEQAGVVVYRRLRQEIRATNTVIIGSLPMISNYQQFWQGFDLGANADQSNFSEVLTVDGLVPFREMSLSEVKTLPYIDIVNATLEPMVEAKRLVYLPTTLMTHLNPESLSRQLEKQKTTNVSIALHSFLATKQQAEKVKPGCSGEGQRSLLQQLNCLALKVTQDQYRKKLDAGKNYVALYRYGRFDYIAYWYQAK